MKHLKKFNESVVGFMDSNDINTIKDIFQEYIDEYDMYVNISPCNGG